MNEEELRKGIILSSFKKSFRQIFAITCENVLCIPYEERLVFYSLYKQANADFSKFQKPNVTQYSLRMKWFAWKKWVHLSKEEAMVLFAIKLRMFLWKSLYDFPNLLGRFKFLSGEILKIQIPSSSSSTYSVSDGSYYTLIWLGSLSYLPFDLSPIPISDHPDPLLITSSSSSISGLPSILYHITQYYILPLNIVPIKNPEYNSLIQDYIHWHIETFRPILKKFKSSPKEESHILEVSEILKQIYEKNGIIIGVKETGPTLADLVFFGDLFYLVRELGYWFPQDMILLEKYWTHMNFVCLSLSTAKY